MDIAKLGEYCRYFEGLPYSGLLILGKREFEKEVVLYLRARGLVPAENWREALQHLDGHRSTFVVLRPPIERELYEVIAQYEDRAGAIHVHDKQESIFRSAFFNPRETHLLLLVEQRELREIEMRYPIRVKVGMIEKVDSLPPTNRVGSE